MFPAKYSLFIFMIIMFLSNYENSLPIKAEIIEESNTIIYNGEIYIPLKKRQFSIQDYIIRKRRILSRYRAEPFSAEFWLNLFIFLLLALFAGTVSGLTVGYLSIDSLILEIKMNNGTEKEKYYAKKIYKLVSHHHWLLVTLLLCNSFACEAMPIVLDKLVNEVVAIVISVTVLLFFGEIIPQALCTGPNQMKIASILAPFTNCLMYVTYPLSYPIAKLMDYLIGVHGKSRFCYSDLKSIIELHVKEMTSNVSPNQIGFFTGFLDIMNKKIGELILPIDKVLKIEINSEINKNILKKLIDSGYSRIPVYKNNPNNLIGILRMKKLLGKDLSESFTLKELGITLSEPIHAYEDTLFLDLFEKFKGGKSHMAFIHEKENENSLMHSVSYDDLDQFNKTTEKNILITGVKGIITLEDLIEFWLKTHILDEEDIKAQKNPNKLISIRQNSLMSMFEIEKVHDKLNKL